MSEIEMKVCEHTLACGGEDGGCGECYGALVAEVRRLQAASERLTIERDDLHLGLRQALTERDALKATHASTVEALREVLDGYDRTGQRSIPSDAIRAARAALSSSPPAPSGETPSVLRPESLPVFDLRTRKATPAPETERGSGEPLGTCDATYPQHTGMVAHLQTSACVTWRSLSTSTAHDCDEVECELRPPQRKEGT